jgi:hypothetical protein
MKHFTVKATEDNSGATVPVDYELVAYFDDFEDAVEYMLGLITAGYKFVILDYSAPPL